MPATSGQGNPKWTRDETILALHLYFLCAGNPPIKSDPRIASLSTELRLLNLKAASEKKTFRNPDGIYFKLQNLRSLDTGKGFPNVSRMDRQVWEELGSKPVIVAKLAGDIRALAVGK